MCYVYKRDLTQLRSSFQNVNIHRTAADALQTVPPHLWWAAAVTKSGWSGTSRSLFPLWWTLMLLFFFSLCNLLTLVTVWVMCLLLHYLCHTPLCNIYVSLFQGIWRSSTWTQDGCLGVSVHTGRTERSLSRLLRNQTVVLHRGCFKHLGHSIFSFVAIFSIISVCWYCAAVELPQRLL